MTERLGDKVQRDLSVGTAWLVVLATIEARAEAVHGYELARALAAAAPEGVVFKHGTLYPILRTMEQEGLVSSELVPSTEGPARKCFRLTEGGRRTLGTWKSSWRRTERWVNQVLNGQAKGSEHAV